LAVKSISGCDINEKQPIKFNAKSFSILIQTDKSLYTPGDLVRYRVLTIDQDTKPVAIKKGLTIEFLDDKNRKIHHMNGISTPKGVYVDTFKLSSSTVLGKWKILVTHQYEVI
jgi:CD109 antigen